MRPITLYRRLSQIVFFGITGAWLFVGTLRCPFGVPFVSCMSCPLDNCPGRKLQPWFIGLIGLSAIIAGRAFCGWACPFGFVQDILGRLPKPKWTKDRRMAAVDSSMKWVKYVALAMLPVAILAFNLRETRSWEYVTRTPSVFSLDAVRVAWSLGGTSYVIGALILLTAIGGGLIILRFWCRYLCPLGAFLGLCNKISMFRIGKRHADCSECGKYPQECPQYTLPGSLDCTVCGKCIEECPRYALRFGRHASRPEHQSKQMRDEAPERRTS